MKRLFKYLGLILFITSCLSSVHFLYSLHNAPKYTREVIVSDLEKAQWRNPKGRVQRFEILSSDLSKRQKEILIKVQAPGFYHHSGIDLSTPGVGLTTITQAIVKKLYFDPFNQGLAKIKQSLIARYVVNDLISKEDQMTLFLNTMYFGKFAGKPIVGLASAANAFYRQPVKRLTEDHFISIVAKMVIPGAFHIIDHPEWNRDRTNRIKALIAGEYEPKGLMDQFYGDLPQEVIDAGLPLASYFGQPIRNQNREAKKSNKINASDDKKRAAD